MIALVLSSIRRFHLSFLWVLISSRTFFQCQCYSKAGIFSGICNYERGRGAKWECTTYCKFPSFCNDSNFIFRPLVRSWRRTDIQNPTRSIVEILFFKILRNATLCQYLGKSISIPSSSGAVGPMDYGLPSSEYLGRYIQWANPGREDGY